MNKSFTNDQSLDKQFPNMNDEQNLEENKFVLQNIIDDKITHSNLIWKNKNTNEIILKKTEILEKVLGEIKNEYDNIKLNIQGPSSHNKQKKVKDLSFYESVRSCSYKNNIFDFKIMINNESDSIKCSSIDVLINEYVLDLIIDLESILNKEKIFFKNSVKIIPIKINSVNLFKKNYSNFKFEMIKVLKSNLNRFNKEYFPNKVQSFVLTFLFDIFKEKDLKEFKTEDFLILEKFLIDRYFKALKTDIMREILESSAFQNFIKLIKINNEPNMSLIEETYDKSIQIYLFKNENQDYLQECLSQLIKILKNSFKIKINSKYIFEKFISFIIKLMYTLLIKFISNRFNIFERIFIGIEMINKPIIQIIDLITNYIIRTVSKNDLNERIDFSFFLLFFKKLNLKNNSQEYLYACKYIKERDMHDFIGIKKQGYFKRPKRTDEKLKKIYKRLMKKLIFDFKADYKVSSNLKKKKSIKNDSVFIFELSDIESDEKTKQFDLFNEENENSRNSLNKMDCKSNINSKKKKNLLSLDYEKLFYKHYFEKTSIAHLIPLNHFHDPLKKNLKNSKYKSFTNLYFRLLLKSDEFKEKIQENFDDDYFMKYSIKNYQLEYKNLLFANKNIFTNQFKVRSRFLWTIWEFYLAFTLFQHKFEL